jgi:DNA-binding transcriptional ArsR family regulator
MDIAALTLFGRARYHVLAGLFALKSGEAIHLREVARRCGLSPTATQYELRLLVQAGLVEQQGVAGRPLYRINDHHAIAKELRVIVRKTDADAASAAVKDDALWSAKRVQQRADYASKRLHDKSTLLARPQRIASLKADFRAKH